jgi:ribosomal-protein-alanine acetyltransferase
MSVSVAPLLPPLPSVASPDGAALVALEAVTQDRPLPLDALLREAEPHGAGGTAGVVLLARDGAVVGMASARLLVDEAHVIRLAVDPAKRRRGIGRQLLDGLLGWAHERHAEAVLLEVRVGNDAALALYADAGFVVEGRRPGYYPDGEDALLLRRSLRASDTGRG